MNFCTGGLTASEGNVLVRGRFVCDDGWGQNEAEVVCRFVDLCLQLALLKFFPLQQSQTVRFLLHSIAFPRSLGYSGGTPTTNSRYGNAPGGDFGLDDVKCQVKLLIQLQSHGFCQGHEDKLTDCQYASYDDCEASEAAGVVCEVDGMFVCLLYIYVFQYC